LRWFGHVEHRPVNASIRESDRIIINEAMRDRGRLRRTWMEAIKNMFMLCVSKEMALNRPESKKKIHVADPKNLG